jgi:hypothetical protein
VRACAADRTLRLYVPLVPSPQSRFWADQGRNVRTTATVPPLTNPPSTSCVTLTRSLRGSLCLRPFSSAAVGSPLFQEWLHLIGEEVVDAKPAPMGPDDALIVIDMQRDFVPGDPLTNPSGGRFGVAEGDHICPEIVQLIDAAASAGATVGATRDYHPHDHMSFVPQGGPFPPHCVQGTVGARFMPQIAASLARALAHGGLERVRIAFKVPAPAFWSP